MALRQSLMVGKAMSSFTGRVRTFVREFRRASAERALARRTSREALTLYREIAAELPELTGTLRYQQIIARHTGADDVGARRFVERAEREFARWPVDRPVRFRDIVQFLIVQRWLAIDPNAQGFLSRFTDIVAKEIPEEL